MKLNHMYKNEIISKIPAAVWADYPVVESDYRPKLLYCERFRGDRKEHKDFTSHEHYELVIVLDGYGTLDLDGTIPLQLEPNRVVLIPPGVRHREKSTQRVDLFWLGFQIRIDERISPNAALSIFSEKICTTSIDFWQMLVNFHPRSGLEMEGYLYLLIGLFFRVYHENRDSGQFLLPDAITFLKQNFKDSISMAQLAIRCNCSEGHFYREFKNLTGKTPVHFLLDIRLEEATRYLIESDLPVIKIGEFCGFRSPPYFNNVFVKHFGKTPLEYRRQYTKSLSLDKS